MFGFYYFILTVLALVTFVYLLRSMLGPTFFDRILAVNNISTVVTIMICILAIIQKEQYIMDIAMIYSMLGFVTVIIVCKAYLRSHNKEKEQDMREFFRNKKKQMWTQNVGALFEEKMQEKGEQQHDTK